MITAKPAARAAFTAREFVVRYINPFSARLRLFGIGYPANKFIASKRCYVVPGSKDFAVACELLPKVSWCRVVHGAMGKRGRCHGYSIAIMA